MSFEGASANNNSAAGDPRRFEIKLPPKGGAPKVEVAGPSTVNRTTEITYVGANKMRVSPELGRAAESFTAKYNAGEGIGDVPIAEAIGNNISPEDRDKRTIANFGLLNAYMLGKNLGSVAKNPELVFSQFDGLARNAGVAPEAMPDLLAFLRSRLKN